MMNRGSWDEVMSIGPDSAAGVDHGLSCGCLLGGEHDTLSMCFALPLCRPASCLGA